MKKTDDPAVMIPLRTIEQRILLIRGQRVILAADLAHLYGVTAKRLNEQVRRNADRFPEDFVFQLSKDEVVALSRSQIVTLKSGSSLRSQIATSKRGRGGQRYLPYAFTEHGAIMAATVLNTEQAVKVGLYVVRAFVKLRELLSTHKELAHRLDELERKLQKHDGQLVALIDAIRQLMTAPEPKPKPPIGYHTEAGARRR